MLWEAWSQEMYYFVNGERALANKMTGSQNVSFT